MKTDPYAGISIKVESAARAVLQGADSYHVKHIARLARTVEILVSENLSGKMLEIGTTGFVPIMCGELLPDLEIEVTRLKEDSPPVAVASDTSFSVGRYTKNLRCYDADLEYSTLPVEDGTFDAVLCCEVLEHMEIDPMFLLEEINRVLKKDGVLIVTTPNVLSSRGLHKILAGIEPYFYMHYHKSREYHRHNYEYSAKSLRALLSNAGFSGRLWSEDLFEDGIPTAISAFRTMNAQIEEYGDNLIAIQQKVSPIVDRYPRGIYD